MSIPQFIHSFSDGCFLISHFLRIFYFHTHVQLFKWLSSALNFLNIFVKSPLALFSWAYFWSLYSAMLICVCSFTSTLLSWILEFHIFLKLGSRNSPALLIFKKLDWLLWPFVFDINVRNSLLFSTKNTRIFTEILLCF